MSGASGLPTLGSLRVTQDPSRAECLRACMATIFQVPMEELPSWAQEAASPLDGDFVDRGAPVVAFEVQEIQHVKRASGKIDELRASKLGGVGSV